MSSTLYLVASVVIRPDPTHAGNLRAIAGITLVRGLVRYCSAKDYVVVAYYRVVHTIAFHVHQINKCLFDIWQMFNP